VRLGDQVRHRFTEKPHTNHLRCPAFYLPYFKTRVLSVGLSTVPPLNNWSNFVVRYGAIRVPTRQYS